MHAFFLKFSTLLVYNYERVHKQDISLIVLNVRFAKHDLLCVVRSTLNLCSKIHVMWNIHLSYKIGSKKKQKKN